MPSRAQAYVETDVAASALSLTELSAMKSELVALRDRLNAASDE